LDEVSGQEVNVLLNDNPKEIFSSTCPTASFVIDMKVPQRICGIGHMAPWAARELLRKERIDERDKMAKFAGEYRISVSDNGKDYRICREGTARVFGREEVFTFPEVQARYVRFEILGTVGKASGWKKYEDANLEVAEISVFARKYMNR